MSPESEVPKPYVGAVYRIDARRYKAVKLDATVDGVPGHVLLVLLDNKSGVPATIAKLASELPCPVNAPAKPKPKPASAPASPAPCRTKTRTYDKSLMAMLPTPQEAIDKALATPVHMAQRSWERTRDRARMRRESRARAGWWPLLCFVTFLLGWLLAWGVIEWMELAGMCTQAPFIQGWQ